MTFSLKIKLGNEAMQTPEDVAAALRSVAQAVDRVGVSSGEYGTIRDLNGNTVGSWRVTGKR